MPTVPNLIETPTGEFALPLVRCAQLVASCVEIQTMFGVESATDAFNAISLAVMDTKNYAPSLPGVIVEGLRQTAGYQGDQNGILLVTIYDEIKEPYRATADQPIDFKNDAVAWLNRCGLIWSQMKSLSKKPLANFDGNRFDAIKWTTESFPDHYSVERGDDDNTQPIDFRGVAFRVEWTT